MSFVGNKLTLVYPKASVKTQVEFNLDQILWFYSDINLCGPYKITAFTSSMKDILLKSTDPTHMKVNPTFLNLTTGDFSPIIKVSYGGSIEVPYSIYLVTETDKATNKHLQVETEISFQLCDNEPMTVE